MEASAVREEKEQGTGILLQDAKNLASGIAATCWLRARRGAACRVGPTSSLEIAYPSCHPRDRVDSTRRAHGPHTRGNQRSDPREGEAHDRLQHVGAATLQRLSSTSRAVARNCLTLDPPRTSSDGVGSGVSRPAIGELNVQREAATAPAEAAQSPANCLQTHSIPPRSYGDKSGCPQRAGSQ